MSGIEERVEEAVEEIPGIAALLVFGSRARRAGRPESDLDIAVLPDEDATAEGGDLFRHRLQKSVAAALADLAPRGRVDVVFLDRAPDTLRQRVMEQGRLVLCHDPDAWRALRVKTMKEYGDREWARRLHRQALRERLLEGGRNGRPARAHQPTQRP